MLDSNQPKHKRKFIVFYLPSTACVVGNLIGKSDCKLHGKKENLNIGGKNYDDKKRYFFGKF